MEEDTLSSEGTGGFCGEKVSSRALARHLKKHLSEKAAKSPEAGKKTFHLLVTGEGWYVTGKVYFLHLLVGGNTMNTLRLLPLLAIFFIVCNQPYNNKQLNNSGEYPCISFTNDDTTSTAPYKTVRGALLGTRFSSFEELKSVIRIEYSHGMVTSDSTAPEYRMVRVHHCSGGREVISVLEQGINEGDFLDALKGMRYGAFWSSLSLPFRCPYAVMNRGDLKKIHTLSRRQPHLFGEGDLAFFDLAKISAEHINTPDLAFRNPRDSTEKGYLNSFNHITAQAFATSCFSEEMTDFVADVHERFRHPELITGKFTEKQIADLEEGPLDNYVDIVNNEWGQELGKQLKKKYSINHETNWTPELLANYLNDLQGYYSWAFQIGFEPFRPEDKAVRRFSQKINTVMNGRLNYNY